MKRLAVALFTVAGFAGVASAADLGRPAMPTKAPAMMSLDDWSGFYLGGHLGGSWASGGYSYDNGRVVEPFGFNPSSLIGGGHLGVQGQWGTWVLGIEGSFDGTSLSQTDNSALVAGATRSLKMDEIATVTARLGYALPVWLFYVKGGWAGVHENNSSFDPVAVTHSFTDWNSGFTVGGGIEYKLTRNWILGAEFDYYNTKFDRSGLDSTGLTTVRTLNSNADIYSVLFRASYLFK